VDDINLPLYSGIEYYIFIQDRSNVSIIEDSIVKDEISIHSPKRDQSYVIDYNLLFDLNIHIHYKPCYLY
jgi:carbonic anhydrase/acetyltransferase-like protein (isoleucine patch superfamily)